MALRLTLAAALALAAGTAVADTGTDKPPPDPVPRPAPVPPPTREALAGSIRRGVEFLLKDQNADGSWGTPERTKGLNIYAPVPGAHQAFRTAVTSLCLTALMEAGGPGADVRRAVERGEVWLFDNLPHLRRATADTLYNIWGHGYAVQALVRMHGRLPGDAARRQKIEALVRDQYDYLTRYESVDGGWGYYDFRVGSKKPATDSTSFMSAAVLVAFHDSKVIGVPPPEKLTKAALDSLHRQQKPDFTYLYGEYMKYQPMHGINQPGGSLGRSQACNLALRLWGDKRITDTVLTDWLDRLFARNGWLGMGRKRPIPHESHFAVAGYFYYFGHYYAARCIDELKPEKRPFYQDQLAHLLIGLQEKDGSWWDFPLYNYHQQYGTAFALMSLHRCHKQTAPK
jgi:hypothetical protein